MPLSNLITMWLCGDKRHKIPPYRMLQNADVKNMKCGRQNLCHMRKMIQHVKRSAVKIGRNDLINKHSSVWTVPDAVRLYDAVQHLFRFENIRLYPLKDGVT